MVNPACSNCGFNNPPGMRFCGNCGSQLEEVEQESEIIAPPRSVGAMIGTGLLRRFRQAGLEAAGQRRNVTVLFADITNYTGVTQKLNDEDLYRLVQKCLHMLAEDVYRYEGMVDKFIGDGLMALFGAPISHENNTERAIRAALDMQSGIDQLSQVVRQELGVRLQVRIGLNAGSVIVGQVGSEMMMDYTAVGDTVNLASRLEEMADPGTILVSENVFRQTKALFDFEKTPPLTLKGFPQPVAGYRAIGLKRSPSQVRGLEGVHAPMVGRDSELAKLLRAVADLVGKKRGQFVLITGEAGIGKTRLTAELKSHIDLETVRVLEGQSLAYRKSLSYWIFLDLLRKYLGVNLDTPEQEVHLRLKDRVDLAFGPVAPQVLPFLEYLLGLEPSDPAVKERIGYLDAEQLRQQIFLAVRDLLVTEAWRRPLLLILDDLHWADEASLELIQFLLDAVRQAPIMLYGVSRPYQNGPLEEIAKRARLVLSDRFVPIALNSLSEASSNELFYQLLAIPDLPELLRDQIIHRAEGNPFYLEEIMRMLIENHLIQQEADHWRLTGEADVANLGVPETLQNLILTRFDRLAKVERQVLQTASVIGRAFTVPLLQEVLRTSLPDNQILAALKTLQEREYILPQEESSSQNYVFKHVLTSDAIYSTMLKPKRGALHGQVGAAIERLYTGRAEAPVELLANHYLNSPRLDRALHFLILAGQKAAREYVNEQARQHFEMALSILPKVGHTAEQALQVHTGLGKVLALVGNYKAARNHFQAALDAVGFQNEPAFVRSKSDLQREMATTFERQGDFDKALSRLEMARQLLGELHQPLLVERARILEDMGWIHFRRGKLDEAASLLDRALQLVEGTSQYDVIASIYNRLGGVYFQKEDLPKASEFTRKGLRLREQIGDIHGVARSYNNLGILAYRLGQWGEALENYKKNLEFQARIGDAEALAISYTNIAQLQVDLGDLEEATVNLTQGMEAARQIGARYHVAVAQMTFGRLALRQAAYQEALVHFTESQKIFSELGVQENLVDVYHLLGEAYHGLGELEVAEQWAQEAITLISKLGSRALEKSEQHGRAMRLLGKIALARQDRDAAGRHLVSSMTIFKLMNSRLEQARTMLEMGRLSYAYGERSKAKKLIEGCLEIFVSLGAKRYQQEAATLLQDL